MVRCCARFPAWSRVKCADQRRLGDATLPGGGRKMGVPVGSIAVGKCYITEIGQVRRVLEVKDGRVKYESRGKTAHGGTWGAWTTVGDGKFAREVERGWTGGIIGDEGTLGTFPIHPAYCYISIQTNRNGSLQNTPEARECLSSRPLVPMSTRHDLDPPSLSGVFSSTNICQR